MTWLTNIIKRGLKTLKDKIEFITSETLMKVKPDVSVLETDAAKEYLTNIYGGKGKCLCVRSPYHPDLANMDLDHNVQNAYRTYMMDLIDKQSREKPSLFTFAVCEPDTTSIAHSSIYARTILSRLNDTTKSITMIRDNQLPDANIVMDMPRSECEHNPQYWQIVVCGVIQTDEGYVFLRNLHTHPRLPNKVTMIQGHVEPRQEMYFMSSADFIIEEFIREVEEELIVGDMKSKDFKDKCMIAGVIQDNSNAVGMEHIGIVCLLDLRATGIKPSDIKTNEVTKHDVVYTRRMDSLMKSEHDSWVPHLKNILIWEEEDNA